ncbi:MAG: hypothetical protein ACPLZG_13200 [Thermoproteota archaeon]
MAKIPKILLMAGLVLLVLGIVLVFASPSFIKVSWEQREEPIEKTFSLLPRFRMEEKSEPFISSKIVTVEPWYSEWTKEWYGTYDFPIAFLYIFGDAKNIVTKWSAVEKSSKIFNFYVFDEKNYNLWKEGLSFKAYYEGKGSTSYSFTLTFSKKEELPSSFYYVVEVPKGELNPKASKEELKRVVEVNAIASWTEIKEAFFKSDYAGYYYFIYTPGISERRNFVIKGDIVEKNGNNFNFYIMDSTNHNNFITDKPFSAHYEKKGISSDSFSVQLTEEQLKDYVYFVVENPNTNINETITLKAKLTYEEKVTDYSASVGAFWLGSVSAILGFLLIVSAGVAHFVLKK